MCALERPPDRESVAECRRGDLGASYLIFSNGAATDRLPDADGISLMYTVSSMR